MGRRPLVRTLDVYINGRLAGYYRFSPSGGTSFLYDETWLDWGYRFPISRALPLTEIVQTGGAVSAVFENLLPDVQDLRKRIAERTSARSDRPHDLLEAIGRDCVGAMQFLPHGEDPGDPFLIDGVLQTEADIAQTLRNLTKTPLGVDAEEPFRISLAGAQEKTAYLRQGDAWLRPIGVTPTTHIFKRPMGVIGGGLDLTGSVENEFFCLLLAREMGLDANHAEIAHFEDQTALVIERFDRQLRRAGGILRSPQEDFLQSMGLYSAQKYQQYDGPSMVDCLELLGQSDDPLADQTAFLKAQIFNWMIAATDGHAKNYSIFLRGDGFRLTPLYDIISAAPDHLRSNLRHKDLQLAMSVGRRNHYRLDQIMPRHFDETASRARVAFEARRRAFEEIVEQAPGAIERVSRLLPIGFPGEIAEQILGHMQDRLRQLTSYVEAQ